MKNSLNRIEPNLYRFKTARRTPKPQPAVLRKRAYSFEISRAPKKSAATEQTIGDSSTQGYSNYTLSAADASLLPDSGKNSSVKLILPEFNLKRDSCDRSSAKPVLEINQALTTETDVAACETQLRRIVDQIESLYTEGPIVDGWLESYNPAPEPTVNILRHDSLNPPLENGSEIFSSNESSHINYRLCGINAAGQKWAYPCPSDQLLGVSVAIARYHKLRQLLKQKQSLETSLKLASSD